jgi:soluble lytic murein transglycosylase
MVRASGAAAVLVLAALPQSAAGTSPATSRGYWLEPAPKEIWENALHIAATAPDPAQAARELVQLSRQDPGSIASGLARVGAGLILAESARPSDAEEHLAHADVALTKIDDFALRALAQVYEKTNQYQKASDAYHRLVSRKDPNPTRCFAFVRGAEVDVLVGRRDDAVALLQRALAECPDAEAQALFQLGQVHEQRGDVTAAVAAYERVDRDHPTKQQGQEAAARLRALRARGPKLTREEQIGHDLKKALVLFEAGENRAAIRLFQSLLALKPDEDTTDLVRVRLGRALLAMRQSRQARTVLAQVTKGSAVESEAAYHLARLAATRGPAPYESVATRFPGTSWGEEALLDIAHYYQRDGKDLAAAPYFRRLLEGYPKGRYADAATFRVGFAEWREKRYDLAAEWFEKAAAERPAAGSWRPAYLYWAGRARRELGEEDKARAHFQDLYTRYKNAYHGIRAREALGQVASGASTTHPAPPAGIPDVAEPHRTRVRQLLLLDRLSEAMEELSAAPLGPQVQATRAWIFNRQGQLRPGMTAMRRAYPEYATESGDALPDAVWRILYPIQYEEALRASAAAAGVDAALVAALVAQESTFDPKAQSGAGARGLMQLMVPTGRSLARAEGIKRFRPDMLYDPATGLRLGTRYLREVIARSGGRVERALAAYNAGPSRVGIWNANRPGMTAEEFVDSIPYSETRTYVMIILASQEQYRRIYGLPASGVGSTGGGRQP